MPVPASLSDLIAPSGAAPPPKSSPLDPAPRSSAPPASPPLEQTQRTIPTLEDESPHPIRPAASLGAEPEFTDWSNPSPRPFRDERVLQAWDEVIAFAREARASDVHFKDFLMPSMRTVGKLVEIPRQLQWRPDLLVRMVEYLDEHCAPEAGTFAKNGDLDCAYESEVAGRLRVNVHQAGGRVGVVVRLIPPDPPTLEGLGMLGSMEKFAGFPDGLIILCGPTGSGKSTTQAAVLQRINQMRSCHILTVEDPVEYRFKNHQALFTQREVGVDSKSFHAALKAALRQDPDVIVIGECRDAEAMSKALEAAETGHLVFTTMHTLSAKEAISRVLDMYPPEQERQVRAVLSSVLRAVVVQRMLPSADNSSRVVVQEIMFNSDRIAETVLLSEEKTGYDLDDIIGDSELHGMQTFNQALVELVVQGRLSVDTAMKASSNPQNLRLLIQSATGNTRF